MDTIVNHDCVRNVGLKTIKRIPMFKNRCPLQEIYFKVTYWAGGAGGGSGGPERRGLLGMLGGRCPGPGP